LLPQQRSGFQESTTSICVALETFVFKNRISAATCLPFRFLETPTCLSICLALLSKLGLHSWVRIMCLPGRKKKHVGQYGKQDECATPTARITVGLTQLVEPCAAQYTAADNTQKGKQASKSHGTGM
jgi:hypothetical protein